MEISGSNPQSSLAVTAYATQQQAPMRSRDGDRDNERVDPNRNTETRRSDNVSFSREAMQLSAPNSANTNRNTVNPANPGDTSNRQPPTQATSPDVARAKSATTVAQAINAYRSTSMY